MTLLESSPPSPDRALAVIRGELSSPRRWFYRAILLAASVMTAAIVSLWATEPGPLPMRLHLAFAAMTAIGGGWIAVLIWVLTRRNCPTAIDRLATSWMATVACALFLAVAIPIALSRDRADHAALYLGGVGMLLLGVAVLNLRGAYSLRARLRGQLAELSRTER
jgi:hypothetical protein